MINIPDEQTPSCFSPHVLIRTESLIRTQNEESHAADVFVFRGFMKEAEEIGASRRMNSLTLNRHTEILEILEIPQLMDTCVRNGYYEEALELAAYVKRLEKKHSCLPVIQVSMRCLTSRLDEKVTFTG